MRLTEHFALSEFKSKDGADFPPWAPCRLADLCEQLEALRAALGHRPITILSGYRSPEHNKAVGGAKRSQHKEARAADVVVDGVSPEKVHATILKLIRLGGMKKGGVGLYPGRFVHYDTRGHNARWRGRGK